MLSLREVMMFDFSYLREKVGKCRTVKHSAFNTLRFLVYLNLLSNIAWAGAGITLFLYIQAYSAPLLIIAILLSLVLSKICPEPPKD